MRYTTGDKKNLPAVDKGEKSTERRTGKKRVWYVGSEAN